MLRSFLNGPLFWAMMVTQKPELTTARLCLRLGNIDDIPAILDYYRANRAYLEPFEPQRPQGFYTDGFWRQMFEMREQDWFAGRALKLLMVLQADPAQVIGCINLNTIVRGALHGATLGYSLAARHQGNGYMTEAGRRLIAYAFDDLHLHRIMANYMPHNQRSANVLQRLGFHIEGMAKDYLLIDGRWQDHVLTSLVNPHWRAPEG